MFGKKKKEPPPDPFALGAMTIGVPLPTAHKINLAPGSTLQMGGVAGRPPQPSLTTVSALAASFRQQMLGFTRDKETAKPEPKDEPKTEIGLIGYRLYTLDNELYLRGARGERQTGQESEPAQHREDNIDSLILQPHAVNHPAPAWDCLCGFAAFFWPTSLEQPGWNGVLAEVQAGGRTIYCGDGWRAERIVLNKLWIACPIFPGTALETLRKRYEVPVEVL